MLPVLPLDPEWLDEYQEFIKDVGSADISTKSLTHEAAS